MNRKAVIAIALLCGIVAGYLINYLVQTVPTPFYVPPGHVAAAGMINVVDVQSNQYLTLRYMGSGALLPSYLPSFSEAGQFPPGHTYLSSQWGFYLGDSLQAYMKVTGPGLDGRTYGVEVSKCAWDELKVIAPSGTYDFAAVSAVGSVSQGYVPIEFIP